ncbi:MAG: phosphoribosyltransferase family protein [Porphyromonadaceae bacterium]|nr:phosphoribosyltransferase family protein [Porphyromonadaceae bacterium]
MDSTSRLGMLLSPLIELLYPSLCPICHRRLSYRSEVAICPLCTLEIQPYAPEIHRGEERLYSCPLFCNLYALYTYQKGCAIQQLIHAIKYHGYRSAAHYIGRAALYGMNWSTQNYDLIIAVPVEPNRLQKRGYNQSLLIAKELAKGLAIEATDKLIRRKRGSHTQTNLGRIERMNNMKHTFAQNAQASKFLKGKHILLVDDVLTTGSTLLEMCYLLEVAGVRSIDIFVAAVAL